LSATSEKPQEEKLCKSLALSAHHSHYYIDRTLVASLKKEEAKNRSYISGDTSVWGPGANYDEELKELFSARKRNAESPFPPDLSWAGKTRTLLDLSQDTGKARRFFVADNFPSLHNGPGPCCALGLGSRAARTGH